MSKKILFRADSSSEIGLGHIMRDLVLAEQFGEDEIIFACRDLEGHIMSKIPYPIMILDSDDIDALIMIVKNEQIEMLVIDHYGITYEDEKKIKEATGVKILAFDDTYEKHHCDILLNHNICAEESRYKDLVPQNCELRCGSKYTLLRDEFYKEQEIAREKMYDVLIAMGGADTANLNVKLLALLPKHLQVTVVTTTANKHLTSLRQYVKDKKNIALHINSNQIARIMHESKLAIVTPSVTVNEVYFMELDFIAIKTAENQEEMYRYLKNNNFFVMKQFNQNDLREKLCELL